MSTTAASMAGDASSLASQRFTGRSLCIHARRFDIDTAAKRASTVSLRRRRH
ncbi:uncharacterized protein ARMOST_08481 [Armillaria ostoyae]|uniref:Uncharacterized protein n=1 Tax=Armillaria ostoyae TaxID=47428 RepID=A0A284R8S7_ARMOS|nr:uncharacterized protein ARMOST_08481 [Armillaria ostoyae]